MERWRLAGVRARTGKRGNGLEVLSLSAASGGAGRLPAFHARGTAGVPPRAELPAFHRAVLSALRLKADARI
jgi:hypothetical protein